MMVNMSKYGRFLAEIRVPTKVKFIYTENDQHIIFVLPNESLFFRFTAQKLIEVLLFLLSLSHQFLLHVLQ